MLFQPATIRVISDRIEGQPNKERRAVFWSAEATETGDSYPGS